MAMSFVASFRRAVPTAFAAVVLGVAAHAAIWFANDRKVTAPDVSGRLESLSFAPYDASQNPEDGAVVTPEQIRADMEVIAPYVKKIRTYAATGGLEHVPEIAAEYGIKVVVGAWIDLDEERNAREIKSALDLAHRYNNVEALIIGNETVLRGEHTGTEMAEILRKVRQDSPVPVTTGDIWSTWLDNPEMVGAVDFIAAHMLGYWEGVPRGSVVQHAVDAYYRLREAYPGKHVVIAEFGWPSGGYNMKAADPGPVAQAETLREFVGRARDLGIDYNIVEAFDQRWKVNEGSVGAYWGLFDAERHLKFDLAGAITERHKERIVGAALLVGTLLSLFVFALARPTFAQAFLLAAAAQGVGAWLAVTIAHPLSHYLVVGSAVMWIAGLLLLVPLALLTLSRIEEIASVSLGRGPVRLTDRARRGEAPPAARPAAAVPLAGTHEGSLPPPKVSIHIPAYREPPEMLKQTLDSVAALAYPNFECVVIINNTPDPSFWLPIEEHCATLGAHFKFLNVEKVAGFKAGALRIALEHTAPDAEIIGLLDADYVVTPDWLADLVPVFDDPRVGLVQAPQDHRDGERSLFHGVLNAEYAGFFDIGMVERNESNAIVVHGTMCLIRRLALEEAGGWSSDTITEDTDLGLSILEKGWTSHYTRQRYGHGLLPDDYQSFKTQRHRWAYGGLQICRKHWRRFLPGGSRLDVGQRAEFSLGWLNWLGAETLGVAAAILNLLWVPVVAFAGIALPDSVLTLPVVVVFLVNIIHFSLLYRLRVRMPLRYAAGAAVAAMSLQFTIARAVAKGLVSDSLPFLRTAKGAKKRTSAAFPATWEAIIGGLLLAGSALLIATNDDEVREITVFAVVLVVQALPFIATVAMALLERHAAAQEASAAPEATVVADAPEMPAAVPVPASTGV